MQKLFYSVVMSFILIFLYWTAMYFAQGYNLTDNIGHLDFKSMTQSLNNMGSFSIAEYLFRPFDNINNILKNGLPVENWNVNSGWKLILTAFNYLLQSLSIFYKPFYFLFSLIKNFLILFEPVNDFISVVLRYIFVPKFI